jgi:hypothetical protein
MIKLFFVVLVKVTLILNKKNKNYAMLCVTWRVDPMHLFKRVFNQNRPVRIGLLITKPVRRIRDSNPP